jgi:hypothetical protein
MVQVIDLENQKGQISEALGMSLGKGLGNALNTYFANRSLNSVLHDKALQKAPLSQKLDALISAASPYGEKGQELLQQKIMSAQQEHAENANNLLSKAFGYLQKDQDIPEEILQGLPSELQLKLGDYSRSNRVASRMRQAMLDAGVPEDIAENQADIIRASERGTGQTYAIQGANDLINRYRSLPQTEAFNQNVGSGRFSKMNPEFEFPQPEKIEGLTTKERAVRKRENEQQNIKDYNENLNNKKNYDEEQASFNKLMELNPKISSGIKKWNINPVTGDIILPALASPEERQFQKILLRQLENAKNSFGAKVSNFEAEIFLKRFPSLADNPEARQAVIRDLQIINKINVLHSKALDEVYKTYKSGEISPIQAKQVAGDMIEAEVNKLLREYRGANAEFTKEKVAPKGEKSMSLGEHFKK